MPAFCSRGQLEKRPKNELIGIGLVCPLNDKSRLVRLGSLKGDPSRGQTPAMVTERSNGACRSRKLLRECTECSGRCQLIVRCSKDGTDWHKRGKAVSMLELRRW